MLDTAYGVIWIRFGDNINDKFPGFMKFCKRIKITSSGYDDAPNFKEPENINKDDPLSYEFYKILHEGGVITKDEFGRYIGKEKTLTISTDPQIERTDDGYILYFNRKRIYLEEIIRASAKLYFGIKDDMWDKIEPFFYAILDCNLDIDESNIYKYIGFLYDIDMIPSWVAYDIADRLTDLDDYKDMNSVKDVIGVDVLSEDDETASKILLDFLLEAIERVRKSKKDSEELKKNAEILKAIIGIKNR
jgi:hypothetical protein